MRHIKIIICLLCILTANNVGAQNVQVEQKIDSIQILIGEQTNLSLAVSAQRGAKIMFPVLKPKQMITPGVEIVEVAGGDTVDIANNMQRITRNYTITSFDEKLYAIPALNVKVNGKNYHGNTLALKVLTVEVDTLHKDKFFPPKDVQSNPFLWSEWSMTFWLSIVLLIICVLVFYFAHRLKENKPIITRIRIVKHIPAHKKALDEIDKIKAESMQTSEDQKQYYTKLTITIRQYIQERFGFNAMEMTSSEIIYRLREAGDQKSIDELHELFETADLVKFAKYSTLINENDLNLVNAVRFIDDTKTDNQETEEKIVPKLNDDEVRTRKNRVTLKSLIWSAIIVITVLLVYIIYNVIQLFGL